MRRKAAALPLALLVMLGAMHAEAQVPAKRPNVVYFLVDNLGMGELSFLQRRSSARRDHGPY
jgi:hypothetical protein